MSSYILAYDADCGPCTRFKRAIEFLDPARKITFTSLVEADESGLLDSLRPDVRYRSFHIISPDGEVYSGSEGLAKTIELLPAGTTASKAIAGVPLGRRSLQFLYEELSRLHDTGKCSHNPRA